MGYVKITITDELFAKLSLMAKEVVTQDNRMTSHPVFKVEDYDSKSVRAIATPPFFTNMAAEQFIADNYHDIARPFIHVGSGHRNDEWQAVRELLKQMADTGNDRKAQYECADD